MALYRCTNLNSSDSGSINTQTKTVTPIFSSQEVTPDNGYNALSSVTVKAIPVSEEANDYGGNTLTVGKEGSTTEDILKAFIQDGTLSSIPADVTSIRAYAFANCSNLSLTSLPSGITSIGTYAFSASNVALTSLSKSLTKIEEGAFEECTSLALTSLPDGVTSIGNYAFYGCTSLALTSLPDGVTSIGQEVFSECSKLAITSIPSSLTSISDGTFYNCTSLVSITFKGTPTSISTTAFYSCSNLKDIYVPWAESAVANAPWGATNATIHYNSTV